MREVGGLFLAFNNSRRCIFHVFDEHAKGSAPVANMVEPDDIVAEEIRKRRARQSPMIVERRWPTCISFAVFGEEKSMTTLIGFLSGDVNAQMVIVEG